MTDFEKWYNSLTELQVGQIIYDFWEENIVEEEENCGECPDCKKLANAIQFHKDSITKYDDKEMAALSLIALYQLNRDDIDEDVEKGLKRLGII